MKLAVLGDPQQHSTRTCATHKHSWYGVAACLPQACKMQLPPSFTSPKPCAPLPPRMSIDVTMMFVSRQNTRNTMCAVVPQRAFTISRQVCVVGALRLISTARMANSRTCTVAPAAYQNGPETPYLYATLALCKIKGGGSQQQMWWLWVRCWLGVR